MAESPKTLNNAWASGPTTPSSCSTGNSPAFLNTATNTLFVCINDVYVPVGGASTVTQTPWIQNIDGGGFTLTNVGGISVNGNINITGQYLINGVPLSASQTPWLSNINGAGFSLANANNLGANGVNLSTPTGTVAFTTYSTATITRWNEGKNNDAETGSNAGSNYVINRYSDGGTFLGTPFFINRATGLVSVANGLNITGNLNVVNDLSVGGNVNITGTYFVNGVPVTTLSQTPWIQNINAAGFNLNNLGILTGASIHILGGPSYFSGGRVGIGTTTPGYPLDVVGDVNISGVYRVNGVPIGGGTPAGANTQIQYNNAGSFGANANLVWDISNSRLGVGIAIPIFPVDIVSTQNYVARIKSTSNFSGLVIDHGVPTGGESVISFRSNAVEDAVIEYDADEDRLTIFTGGHDAAQSTLTCDTNSRVGILTTTPAYELDVIGDCNITGVYRINGVPLSFAPPTIPIVVAAGAFSGGGSALVGGTSPGVNLVYCVPVIKACTAISWTVTVDTGTAGIRVWRIAAGTAVPTVANSITTADLAISTGTNLKSTSFVNFTGGTAPIFAVGDIIAVQLNTVATATYVAFSLVAQ